MTWGTICWVISAAILLFLGFGGHLSLGSINFVDIALGLIPAGLVLNHWAIPVTFVRPTTQG